MKWTIITKITIDAETYEAAFTSFAKEPRMNDNNKIEILEGDGWNIKMQKEGSDEILRFKN